VPAPPGFDPEAFRTLGHGVVDRLADYLTQVAERPVLPWREPDAHVAAWPVDGVARGEAAVVDLLTRVVAESNHLHHPRYIGHQVTAPLPLAALCDLVSSLLNNGNAVYEMGPVVTAMERNLVRYLGGVLGFAGGGDGVLTSGGSAGNLTALLAARQAKAGFDAWGEGAHAGPPLAVLASSQTHYCIARSLQIMGLGKEGAQPVPVDARFRLRAASLDRARRIAETAGRKVIAVVASAGSTATGAFDPLAEVADFCAEHDLWLHVDGAHGASAMLSATHAPRLAGIERADSVVWDAHKMMLMPALVTAVLFRDGRHSYEAFAQEASYLFPDAATQDQGSAGFAGPGDHPHERAERARASRMEQWFNLAGRTLECTKSMMALKLYVALATYGRQFFADYVDGRFALAQRFADAVEAAADFELAVRPDCNIVCFRLRGAGGREIDQGAIRRRLLAEGRFYLVQTTLPTGVFLRVTIINPATTDADLAEMLDAVRAAAT
jgi:L-2,4-diaminobutyrate decarboxylase